MSLLFLALIVGTVIVFFGLSRRSGNGIFASMYGRKTTWMLSSYFIILLLGTAVFLALPEDRQLAYEEVNEEEWEQMETIHHQFYEAIQKGHPVEVDGIYVHEQWDFHFDGEELMIGTPTGEHLGMSVFVERQNHNDKTIEIINYKSKTIVRGIDFSEVIQPPHIEMRDHQLWIRGPERYEVEFSTFENEFTIRQFTGQGSYLSSSSTSRVHMEIDVLYILIPEHVEVMDNPNVYIEYIGE